MSEKKYISPILEQKIQNQITPTNNDASIISFNFEKNPGEVFTTKAIDLTNFFSEDNENLDNLLNSFLKKPNINSLHIKVLNIEDFSSFIEFNKFSDNSIKKYFKMKNLDFLKIKEQFQKIPTIEEKMDFILTYLKEQKQERINKILTMKNDSFVYKENTGGHQLFLSQYFLRGFVEDLKICAPLILCSVKLKIINNSEIIITKDFVTVNTRLLFFLKRKIGLDYTHELYHFNSSKQAIDFLKDIFSTKPNISTEGFLDDLEPFLKSKNKNNLTVFNNIALQLVEPFGSNSLIDLQTIKENNELADIFIPIPMSLNKNEDTENAILNDELVQIGFAPLNFDQRLATAAAQKNHTVIYGPPGTGKSETLSSIIANYIVRGKSVLMSSEKKPALNEVHDRLKILKTLALPIHFQDAKVIQDKILIMKELLLKSEVKDKDVSLSNNIINVMKKENYENSLTATKNLISSMKQLKKTLNKRSKDDEGIDSLAKIYQKIPSDVYEKMIKTDIVKQILIIEREQVDNNLDIFKILENNQKNINAFNFLQKLSHHHYRILFTTIWENEQTKNFLFKQLKLLDPTKVKAFDSFEIYKLKFVLDSILNKNVLAPIPNKEREPVDIEYDDKKIVAFYRALMRLYNSNLTIKKIISLSLIHSFKPHLKNMLKVDQWLRSLGFDSIEKLLNIDINEETKKYHQEAAVLDSENETQILKRYIIKKREEFQNLDVSSRTYISKMFSVAATPAAFNSLNNFINTYYYELKWLFPVWLLLPHQVSALIPLTKNEFEYGVFDEASQMFFTTAIPILYRCETKIIAGDDKQMRPSTNFLLSLKLDEEDLQNDIENDNVDSLLEKAKLSNWQNFHLKNHYRAKKETNIKFVNDHVYNKNLNIVPTNSKPYKDLIVKTISNPILDGDSNETEVTEAIRILFKEYKENPKQSIMLIFSNEHTTQLCEKYLNNEKLILSIANPNFQPNDFKKKLSYPKITQAPKTLTKKFINSIPELILSNEYDLYNENNLKTFLTNIKEFNYDSFQQSIIPAIEEFLKTIEDKTLEQKNIEIIKFCEQYRITKEIILFYLNKDNFIDSKTEETTNKMLWNSEDFEAVRNLIFPPDGLEPQITIRNVDSCQGAEADVVVISFGFIPDFNQKTNEWKLSSKKYQKFSKNDSGKNVLNVMITRNKVKTYVLKSFKSNIMTPPLSNEKPDYNTFYEYIRFLDKKEKNQDEATFDFIETPILNLVWKDIVESIKLSFPENFVSQLAFAENFFLGNQEIDFAIFNKKEGAYKMILLKNEIIIPSKKKIDIDYGNLNIANVSELLFKGNESSFVGDIFKHIDKIEYLIARGFKVYQILDFCYKVNRKNILTNVFQEISKPASWRK
ncbi:MAG: AAA domain-containing protein [Mycoplasma sp.]